jgi:hypothetical protein
VFDRLTELAAPEEGCTLSRAEFHEAASDEGSERSTGPPSSPLGRGMGFGAHRLVITPARSPDPAGCVFGFISVGCRYLLALVAWGDRN